MRFVAQLFWRWLPHRCRFRPVAVRVKCRAAVACRRCGCAVYFDTGAQ